MEHRTERGTLGEYLLALRQARKLSLRQVANEARISASYLSHLERGQRERPARETLERLARVYGVDRDVLLRIMDDPDTIRRKEAQQRIEWAFEAVCRDPELQFGPRLSLLRIPFEVKAMISELYQKTGRRLLKEDELASAKDAWKQLFLPAPFPGDLFRSLAEEAGYLVDQGLIGIGINLAVTAAEARLREICAVHEIEIMDGVEPMKAAELAALLHQEKRLSTEWLERLQGWLELRGRFPRGRVTDRKSLEQGRQVVAEVKRFLRESSTKGRSQ